MMEKAKVLIVDDEQDLLDNAEDILSDYCSVSTALSVPGARNHLSRFPVDLVVADLNFEGQDEDGLSLLDFIAEKYPNTEIVVLSSDHMTSRVVNAMKRSLVDFIPKAGGYSEALTLAVTRGLQKKKAKDQGLEGVGFLTNSPKMKELLNQVNRIARSSSGSSILVVGETGTGKEVLANYVAKALGKKIVATNMAAIPKETAESELFGHVKGAFTGAVCNKAGLIEQAHGGVFFLDELGECSLSIQAKLLRVIQERELRSVGDTKYKKLEVRFLAATNRDLSQMVAEGTFREDLFQRLNTFELRIPPLRERPEDISLYANLFLTRHWGSQPFTLTHDGLDALLSHSWPGNVRELENTIERITVLAEKRIVDVELVEAALHRPENRRLRVSDLTSPKTSRMKVIEALRAENGNRTRAAANLGVHLSTLQRWITRLGIREAIQSTPGRPSTLKGSHDDSSIGGVS